MVIMCKNMPEGPEVAMITDHIRDHLKEEPRLTELRIREAWKGKFDGVDKFMDALEGSSGFPLKVVESHGKKTILWFENMACVISYALTGEVEFGGKEGDVTFVFTWDDGKKATMNYSDPRKFGDIAFGITRWAMDLKNNLGVDPLKKNIPMKTLGQFSNTRRSIALIIIDQHIISGVGNKWRSEVLYEAEIHPQAKMNNIPKKALENLTSIIESKLRGAYAMMEKGKTPRLEVYKKAVTSSGARVEHVSMGGGRVYYVPSVQTIGME